MEDDEKMKKWETEIGDFWNTIEGYYPVQPYQPVKVSNLEFPTKKSILYDSFAAPIVLC